MSSVAKIISQVLLLVLPKVFDVLWEKFKEYQASKKLEAENQKKGTSYEEAKEVGTARDAFERLP